MTGYTVHTGSSEKFSEGWDQIFKKKAAGGKKSETPEAKKAEKKPGKKAKKK